MPTAKDPDVVVEINIKSPAAATPPSPPVMRPVRRKRHYVLWTIFVLLVGVFLWLATSSNPFAEGIPGICRKQARRGRGRSSLFSFGEKLPLLQVQLARRVHQRSRSWATSRCCRTLQAERTTVSAHRSQPDNAIEVYVLSESSFAVWQTGYATSSVFESGRIPQGKIAADLPPGPGVYYLVFSNKFSPSLAKKVDATVVLHYKNWIPGWIRQVKGELRPGSSVNATHLNYSFLCP